MISFSALSAPVMARGPFSQLPLAFAPLMAHGAVPLSICIYPTLGTRCGHTKHSPCLLYLLLLWRAACPAMSCYGAATRSERSVGGPARISLLLDFGAFRPVCKRAPRAGGRLVHLSRMVTHAVTSMPKTAKMSMRSATS